MSGCLINLWPCVEMHAKPRCSLPFLFLEFLLIMKKSKPFFCKECSPICFSF